MFCNSVRKRIPTGVTKSSCSNNFLYSFKTTSGLFNAVRSFMNRMPSSSFRAI
ncbi:MAG: PhzA/PhzB family protein [Agathobacter sp.]|nr:PhzA/PhzB family protein [Agathobacter sp.]